jgi:hypothetical protein
MKRQRGRNRKPGGGSGGGGGGGGGGNNPNRAFESNGPEGLKTRGNAQHVYERYQQLARDAFTSGDRVLAENYLQHAEHYFRVLRTLQPSRPVSEIAARDAFASGFDIDFEDESGDQAMDGDQPMDNGDNDGGQNRDNGQRENGQRDNGNRDNGNRDDYRRDRDDRDFRNENRDQPRDQRNQEPRENRDFGENREPRPARDFGGEARPEGESREGQQPRREGRRERFERRRNEERGPRQEEGASSDPLAVVEPRGAELPQSQPVSRAPAVEEDAGSHLPAFLRQPSAPAAPAAGGDEVERPRRAPRRRRSGGEDEDGAPSVEAAEEDA